MKDQEEEANRNEVVQFYQALFAYESKVVLEDGREQSIATPAVLDATFTDLSKKSKVNRLKYFPERVPDRQVGPCGVCRREPVQFQRGSL
mmetsp:Transcript_4253/g.5879  ORF Transcript_4253/g.5879 Transcript_4253/m.5879 type:complete len:90 (+) Transcript_4253:1-270(+)